MARSRAKRWRRAISNATTPTSHGLRGAVEGLLDAPDLQHEHPLRAQFDGPPERDAVDETAVQVVVLADPDRGEQAGHRGGGEDGVDDRSVVEPVLGGVLDPGGAALERHRQVLDAAAVELRDERSAQRYCGVRGGAGARQLA